MKKEKAKYYNKKTRHPICLKLNVKEDSVLEKAMQQEGWTNKAGYIKDCLFGESAERKYEKMLTTSDPVDMMIVIKNELEEFNRRMDYISYKLDDQMEEFKKQKNTDPKSSAKWFAYMVEWKKSINEISENLYASLKKLCHSLSIEFQRKKYDKVETLPDYVLERVEKDWNDTLSPEARYIAKKKTEEFQKIFEERVRKSREKAEQSKED